MHRGDKLPSLLSRHRVVLVVASFWIVFWSVVIYVFYRFPYTLDAFHLKDSTASITELAIMSVLIAFALTTAATVLDAFIRDRKRWIRATTPRPVVNEALFTNKSLTR